MAAGPPLGRARPGIVRQVTGEEVQVTADGKLVATESFSPTTLAKYASLLVAEVVDLEQLRHLAWQGVPSHYRPVVWKLLMGYWPQHADRRPRDAARKEQEYRDHVKQYFDTGAWVTSEGASGAESPGAVPPEEVAMRHQIHIDVPRTCPEIPVFQTRALRECLERLLYVWSARHPASGYVQGLNDLATPFLVVFLAPHAGDVLALGLPAAEAVLGGLSPAALHDAEASACWCFSRFLDRIQDHYTFAQPGIQKMVRKMEDLVKRMDGPLHSHLTALGIHFLQFAFRWVNCLLLRELPMPLALRLWDTYLAEGDGFPSLHVYVCAGYLMHWSPRLRGVGFAEAMLLIQSPPAGGLDRRDLEALISQAYMWREMYEACPSHLQSSAPS